MIVADNAAALNPFDIDAVRNIAPAIHMNRISTTPSVNGKLR